jgi:moderate conductance mechanosensitive channel
MGQVAEDLQLDPTFGPNIIEPIEILGVDNFADSAVIIKARIKTQPGEHGNVGREYRRRLKKAFDAQKIEIPFPHRSLYIAEAGAPFKVEVLTGPTPARA